MNLQISLSSKYNINALIARILSALEICDPVFELHLFVDLISILAPMKIKLLTVGKTEKGYLKEGVEIYLKKISHYLPFTVEEIQSADHSKKSKAVDEEGKKILKSVKPNDKLVLLDHMGKTYSSEEFAEYIERGMSHISGTLIFVVGGPFGFSDEVYQRADLKVSLSKMIFSHQMIRLIFLEQLYRAMTIIRNEPYHHA